MPVSMADAFMADILANPDDDTPRLIFADYLDENGDSDRAEFIRAQVEIALAEAKIKKMEDHKYLRGAKCACEHHRKIDALGPRVAELLFAIPIGRWSGFPKQLWKKALWTFRRGFVHTVVCPADLFIRHGNRICRQPVEEVTLTHYPPNFSCFERQWHRWRTEAKIGMLISEHIKLEWPRVRKWKFKYGEDE